MAELVLTNAGLWLAELALHCQANKLALDYGAEVKDATALCDLTRRRAGGLKAWGVQMDGHWQASDDAVIFGDIGYDSVPITVAPVPTVGQRAFLGQTIDADYSIGTQVGEIFPFSAGGAGNGPLARGLLMHHSALTTTTNGTGQQLGALSATQKMLAAVHVPIVTGTGPPSLTVLVESDDNSGFTTPTTRNTFTALTAAGWLFASISGAITDDWWRFKFTITGGSPSFTIAGAMGIV